ncbi:MAG: hypothetical protein KDD70_14955, partial [Bdellovibrionales bacterium]|nr:hypothetical protein [Bdellovibrionales bacterium]
MALKVACDVVKNLLVTISLFILVLIGAFDVAAQVDLYVYNGDYESVANATVSIELTGSGTPIETRTTDSFGVASFTGAFSGMTYDVRVTKNGQMGNFDEVVPTFIDTASSSFEYVYLLGYPPLDQLDLTIYDGTFSYVDGATVTILFGTTPIEQSMTDSFGTAGFSFSTPLDADVNYDIRVELGTFSETVPLQIKNSFHDVNLTGAPSGTLMVDYLYFSVTNSSLIGAEGVYVDLYDEFDFLVFSCLTDENGDCFETIPYSPLLEGDYRVELVPWATSLPLLQTTRYLTIDETTAVYSNGFYEVTDSFFIDEASRSIKVEIYEAVAGTSTPDLTKPVEDVYVDAYPADPELPPLTSGITGSNGVAYLPISDTTSGFYNINIFSPNGVNDVQPITIEQGTSDVVVQFALNLGDADIVIALENSSGQALVAQESQFDPERSDIFVNCFLEFETTNPEEFPTGAILNADANVPIGQSGTTLKVSGGYTYRCSAFNEATGEPISQQTVVAVTGVPQSVTLRAVEKDASVTIRLLDDATGALIVGPRFYVDAFTDYSANSGGGVIDDFDFGDTVDGTVTLQLVAGQDYVGFANPDFQNFDENGFPTISLGDYLPSSEVQFTASNNLIVEIRLDKYD